jgi:hypothetical protein
MFGHKAWIIWGGAPGPPGTLFTDAHQSKHDVAEGRHELSQHLRELGATHPGSSKGPDTVVPPSVPSAALVPAKGQTPLVQLPSGQTMGCAVGQRTGHWESDVAHVPAGQATLPVGQFGTVGHCVVEAAQLPPKHKTEPVGHVTVIGQL